VPAGAGASPQAPPSQLACQQAPEAGQSSSLTHSPPESVVVEVVLSLSLALTPVLSPVVSPPVEVPVSEVPVVAVADAVASLVAVVVDEPPLALAPEGLVPALAVALPSVVLLPSVAAVDDDPEPEALVIGSSPLQPTTTSGATRSARHIPRKTPLPCPLRPLRSIGR
jgi:hypothetical protein